MNFAIKSLKLMQPNYVKLQPAAMQQNACPPLGVVVVAVVVVVSKLQQFCCFEVLNLSVLKFVLWLWLCLSQTLSEWLAPRSWFWVSATANLGPILEVCGRDWSFLLVFNSWPGLVVVAVVVVYVIPFIKKHRALTA